MATVPTIEVFRDGKRCVCNVSDLERFKADGWIPWKEVAKVVEPAPVVEPVTPEKPTASKRGKAKAG